MKERFRSSCEAIQVGIPSFLPDGPTSRYKDLTFSFDHSIFSVSPTFFLPVYSNTVIKY